MWPCDRVRVGGEADGGIGARRGDVVGWPVVLHGHRGVLEHGELVRDLARPGGGQAEHGNERAHAEDRAEHGQHGRGPAAARSPRPPRRSRPARSAGATAGRSPSYAWPSMTSLDPFGQHPVADRDRPAGVGRHCRVVRDHHDREAGRVQLVEQFHQRGRVPRVQVPGRLVAQQQARPVHQRPRYRDPLALPAGQRGGQRVEPVSQPDRVERVDRRPDPAAVAASGCTARRAARSPAPSGRAAGGTPGRRTRSGCRAARTGPGRSACSCPGRPAGSCPRSASRAGRAGAAASTCPSRTARSPRRSRPPRSPGRPGAAPAPAAGRGRCGPGRAVRSPAVCHQPLTTTWSPAASAPAVTGVTWT